ncbi:MAG: helix-turn-helix domain-containing protein, partial [Candidatus Binatia bacterium]
MSDSSSGPIPTIRLGRGEVPARVQFDAWREMTRPFMDTTPCADEQRFKLHYEAYALDGLVVCDTATGAHTIDRGPRQLRSGDTDHVTMRVYARGRMVMDIGKMPVMLAPGEVSLFDRRYPMRGHATEHRALSCMIPRERLNTRPFNRSPTLMWSCNTPQGRLLGNALQTLWAALPRARAEDAKGLAAGVTGLINGLLSARPDDEARRSINQATLAAMQVFIERHLHDRTLDAATLCRTFACSRARLYRLFRPYGGVERYVRDQRLQRCFDELMRADPTRGRIRAVAAKWGFENPSHFHRLFKARLGIVPSDVPPLGPDPDG